VNKQSSFDVLLFDLGGVLMDFAGFEELGDLIPGSPRRSEVRDRWIHSTSVQQFERGEITPQRFAEGVIEELRIDLTPPEFLVRFVDWAQGPYPGAIALLDRLRRDYRVAALSNANELHTPLHRRRFGSVIGTFYFSEEIGAVKPDRAIFEHVVDDLGVPPDRIAFFDDTPVNVDAAREIGIAAYTVDGLSALGARLHDLGIRNRIAG
jgi:HAD superfamily hydrolase (TIGR01509 family)